MIQMFGQTTKALQISEQDIAATIRETEAVRRNVRHLADWTCTREEAIQMATEVREIQVRTRLADRAWAIKFQRPGRFARTTL